MDPESNVYPLRLQNPQCQTSAQLPTMPSEADMAHEALQTTDASEESCLIISEGLHSIQQILDGEEVSGSLIKIQQCSRPPCLIHNGRHTQKGKNRRLSMWPLLYQLGRKSGRTFHKGCLKQLCPLKPPSFGSLTASYSHKPTLVSSSLDEKQDEGLDPSLNYSSLMQSQDKYLLTKETPLI